MPKVVGKTQIASRVFMGELETVSVFAVCGQWGVTSSAEDKRSFAVSHLPTGLKAADHRGFNSARRLAKALAADMPEFDLRSWSKELIAKGTEILRSCP